MIIATYNVEFLFDEGEHQHSGQTWIYRPEYVAERVKKLAQKFKEMNADVLLLQEVGSQSVIHKIIEQSGLGYTAFFGGTDRFGVGNVALYRVPVVKASSIPTTGLLPVFGSGVYDTLSPNIPSRRDFVHITVDYHGTPLHVIGQHLKANFLVDSKGEGITDSLPQLDAADALIRSEMFRLSQAKKLRGVVDDIFAVEPQAHIIVAGDFNAKEADSVQRIIRGVQEDREDVLQSATSGIAATQRYTRVSADGVKYQIDDVLYSAGLKRHVATVAILNQGLTGHKNKAPYLEFTDSDHAPIVLQLN